MPDLFYNLSNPERLRLLRQIVEHEHGVSDPEVLTGIAQPMRSQKSGVLRDDGLVETGREVKRT